jgi:hypothetical protein
MKTNQISGPQNPDWKASRRSNRRKATLVVAVLAALGYGAYTRLETRESSANPEDILHMPVANPPNDPDRPDLIGEPRIDEQ